MKKLYSLFALVALLFAACSENASSISGSTSVPNMGNNLTPESPVLCSTIGVTDSLEAIEKGCIWSPDMWNRTSGYRVRTGYDNGTNTSGIWTWHTEPGTYENARFEWPGMATAEYDSMALADVIDKCGGSLCGKVVHEPIENNIDSENTFAAPRAYVEFYFAGKDSLGNIEDADVSAMQGICVEYSGDLSYLELLPSDSIADLNKFSNYTVYAPYFRNQDDGSLPESQEVCFPWYNFGMYTTLHGNQEMPQFVLVPFDDFVAHLKGVRFYFHVSNTDFNIISIGRYHLAYPPMTNLHPVDETCVPTAVTSTFCECDLLEEFTAVLRDSELLHFMIRAQEIDLVSYSVLTNECIDRTTDSLSNRMIDFFEKPCDNPLPRTVMCADGTSSESQEYAYAAKEFDVTLEKGIAAVDSLFNYCLSLSD